MVVSFILLEGSLLDVNPGTIIWTLITFLLLLFLLGKVAWKPVLKALSEREKKIDEALRDAKDASEKAKNANEESAAIIAKSHLQADKILAEAKDLAEKTRKSLEEKAKKEALGMVESAKKEIEMEKLKASEQLRQEVVHLSVKVAELILKRELEEDEAKQRAIVENLIAGLSINEKN